MNTAMSTKRIIVPVQHSREAARIGLWVMAFAAGLGVTYLGVRADSAFLAAAGATLVMSGLLYANNMLWSYLAGRKRR